MKILHVTPHLGGGVGKAHAAIRGAFPREVEQTFVLLEAPRDCRYLDMIEAGGARVLAARNLGHVAYLASQADIVQFEFWNHPRLFECLARTAFPTMRSVFWSHISGLFKPVIQPGLMEEAGRFVFTTEASWSIPSIAMLPEIAQKKLSVINSGFGIPDAGRRARLRDRRPAIAYLGTVDFIKMHPGFFDAIDRLDDDDIRVSVWGDPAAAVAAYARTMRHSERIKFCGETSEPTIALSEADIFFYPLQPDHYGTAENALIEAMSLGLAPVVLSNPAEMAIIQDGETGFIAHSIEECASLLQRLLASPELRERVSRNAVRYVAETRTPRHSARNFLSLWLGLLNEPTKHCDFRGVVGDSPRDWFLATQCLAGATWDSSGWANPDTSSKGTLAHFESVFAGDASFSRLRL
jgi:glycosyltransferase involved in cell wall biosynthesis